MKNVTLDIYAGDSLEIICNVVDQDKQPVDLTGGEVLWQLGQSNWPRNPVPVLSKDSTNPNDLVISGSSFLVKIYSAETHLKQGNYYHEAQVTLADGSVGHPIGGKVKIRQSLTDQPDTPI